MRVIPVRLWVFAILSGVLQILSFPIAGPIPIWRSAICWIALAPLLFALTSRDSKGNPIGPKPAAMLGYVSGFIWYLGNCYWIYATMNIYGGLSKPVALGILVLFCLYLGLYHALFAMLIGTIHRSRFGRNGALLLAPFAWVAVELARARITGFPWDQLGVAQVDNSLLIRLAPLTGAYGLSFVIAAVNAAWLARFSLKERRHTRTILTGSGVVVVLLYIVFLRHLQAPNVETSVGSAVLLQENLGVGAPAEHTGPPLSVSQEMRSFSALSLFPPQDESCNGIPELPSTQCGASRSHNDTSDAATRYLVHSDLIVWPEAPNDFFDQNAAYRHAMSQLAQTAHAAIIVGDIGTDPDPAVTRGYDLYNSADFIHPDGTFAGRYDKMHLVPFGEYVPYRKLLFFAGNLLGAAGDFDRGKQRTVFITGGHTYGTFICYESVFGDEVRQYAKLGAEVLINISDDGWYGDTSAAWEHLNMVRMRAIENHRWVLRATNTGVTAVIDPYGKVVTAAPRHIRTSLPVRFGYENDLTFYVKYGDLFAYLCALVTIASVAIAISHSRAERA